MTAKFIDTTVLLLLSGIFWFLAVQILRSGILPFWPAVIVTTIASICTAAALKPLFH